MLYIFRFLCGYLRVFVLGGGERILNLTAKNSISFWNTKLKKDGIEGYISVRDFKKLAYLKRPKGFRIHILKRYGLPFKLKSNRRKLRTVLCLAVFFITLWILSQYIWSIEIIGSKITNETEIIAALREIGIYEGVRSTDISPKTDRELLLLKLDTLSWCSLNVEGSRLTVNVSEITEKESAKTPANLVAEYDGIITKINVTSGSCLVKVGDTVAEGEVLVSGIIENTDGTKFAASSGEIIAEIQKEFTLSDSFKQSYTYPTGKVKQKRVLEIFTLKIPLYLGKETETAETRSSLIKTRLFGQNLPIKIHEKEFTFTKTATKTLTEAELLEKLRQELKDNLNSKGIENYQILSESIDKNSTGITLKTLINAQINIASTKEIHISPE